MRIYETLGIRTGNIQCISNTNWTIGTRCGIFLYGSQNYKMSNDLSDIDTYSYFIPSRQYIARKPEFISTTIELNDGSDTLKDIRTIPSQIYKVSPSFLEILYTPYSFIPTNGKNLFQFLRDNRDELSRADEYRWVMSMRGKAHEYYKKVSLPEKYDAYKACANLLHTELMISGYQKQIPYSDLLKGVNSNQINIIREIKFEKKIPLDELKAMASVSMEHISLLADNSYYWKSRNEKFINDLREEVHNINARMIVRENYY